MPRKSIGERPMTDAERQARHRAAHAAGLPVIRTNRAADHRSRARRWMEGVAGLVELQAEYAAWLDSLPDSLQDSATGEALRMICELDTSATCRRSSRRAASEGTDRSLPRGQLAPVGLQAPPARRCVGLAIGTPRRAGPPLWTTGTSHDPGRRVAVILMYFCSGPTMHFPGESGETFTQ